MKKAKVISLILAAAMLSSCGKADVSETTKERETTTTETTAEATTEETTTVETTAAPTPSPEPVAFDSHMVDAADNGNIQHDIIKAKVDELEAAFPGSTYYLNYAVDRATDGSTSTGYWILYAFTSEGPKSFAFFGGELCELTNVLPGDMETNGAVSYDVFTAIPFLYPTFYLSFNPDTSYMPASVDDGLYGGLILGVSDDGSTALVALGSLIAFDRSEMLSLAEGDPIGYEDLVVMRQDSSSTGIPYISVSDGMIPMALTGFDDNPDSPLYLKVESDAFVFENVTIAILPISQTAEINSSFSGYGEEYEGYEDIAPTGKPMLDSYFWFYNTQSSPNGWYSANNNGWHSFAKEMEPVVISNNEIVSISMMVP